jgi:hypothetical protein
LRAENGGSNTQLITLKQGEKSLSLSSIFNFFALNSNCVSDYGRYTPTKFYFSWRFKQGPLQFSAVE